MKAFIIWNKKEDRPAIMHSNYGALATFLTLEQAQAHDSSNYEDRRDYEIREVFFHPKQSEEFDEFCKTCDQHIPYDCECDTYNAAISESMTKIKDRI